MERRPHDHDADAETPAGHGMAAPETTVHRITAHGRPPVSPRLTRVDTRMAPKGERFDFWRSLFPSVELWPMSRDGGRAYRGVAAALESDDGVSFARVISDPTSSRAYQDPASHIMLSFLTAGEVEVRHGHNRIDRMSSQTGFVLHQSVGRAETRAPGGHDGLHVTLPRALVHEAMGGRPTGPDGRAMRALPVTPLAHVLRRRMQALEHQAHRLDPAGAQAALRELTDLSLAYLRQTAGVEDACAAAVRRFAPPGIGPASTPAPPAARNARPSRGRGPMRRCPARPGP